MRTASSRSASFTEGYWQLDTTGTIITAAPLPQLPGPELSVAHDINENGVVIGTGGVSPNIRPIYWPGLTSNPVDLPIPGWTFGFSTLKNAQALGDFQALLRHGRRVVRCHIAGDPATGLKNIAKALGN